MELTQNYIQNVAFYDNGKLIRRFSAGNRQAMTPMGSIRTSNRSKGRREVWLGSQKDGKSYLNSHLIWLYFHGYMPAMIGHLNHDITDDRIENLAEMTRSQMQSTGKAKKNSKTGVRGVQKTRGERFITHIGCRGNKVYLGTFKTLEEAKDAYIKASEKKLKV